MPNVSSVPEPDFGTLQAYGVVTNAQDFMQVLRSYVERCRTS